MATRDRGRRNTNERGSSKQRRARKLWLLKVCGDGLSAPCWECLKLVTYTTMVVDRIIPGYLGGTYRRNNIRVHCQRCSARSGALLTNEKRWAAA